MRMIKPIKVVKGEKSQRSVISYSSPQQVYDSFYEMKTLDREHFRVLHVDGKNRIICDELISVGSLNQALVHPREVFKGAMLNGSAAIICMHNHPTGDPTPSSDDRAITRSLREVGELLGIQVLDHIIFGDKGYYSFANCGWPSPEIEHNKLTNATDPLTKGFERQDSVEDLIETTVPKTKFLFSSLMAVASSKETYTESEIEGLAWLIKDIETALQAASECLLYRKPEKQSESKSTGDFHVPIFVTKKESEDLLRAYLNIKSEHPDKILLFLSDGIFTLILDDAVKVSALLGLKLKNMELGKNQEHMPAVTFDAGLKEGYIFRLVSLGKKIAICESVQSS